MGKKIKSFGMIPGIVLKPKTEIKNLFLTGQDIVTAGVGGALFSGLLTAIAVSKKNLFKKIKKSVI